MNEFELIRHYFQASSLPRTDVIVGIGDDCALLASKPNYQLAVTTDTMVEGVHFDERLSPYELGYKLMAVNLSDLAAMGAEPCWVSLALTLPSVDETWLAEFSRGLAAMAQLHNVSLIGGDTTRGPLTLTLTAHGQVPSGEALQRGGAQVGDLIFVSGHLGDGAMALNQEWMASLPPEQRQGVEARLFRPSPRVDLGRELRQLANACIDLSDGLIADLGHILKRSGVGARVEVDQLPVSDAACSLLGAEGAARQALKGGDDYELCFTLPPALEAALSQAALRAQTQITCVGQIISGSELELNYQGEPAPWQPQGYLHFN